MNIRKTVKRSLLTSVLVPQRSGGGVKKFSIKAKLSKSFSLIDCISVGVDRMQRNFEPMRKQVEAWQKSELTDVTAEVVIYEAFVEGLSPPQAMKHFDTVQF